MKQLTATGPSIDEAVQSALEQLQTSKDQVTIDIIDEGKKGFLGFGSKPAIVKVSIKKNPLQDAETFIYEVAEQMGAPVQVHSEVRQRDIFLNLEGEHIAVLIGKRGQTLNSLQYLVQLVVNRGSDVFYTVMLDAEGYRSRRKETLENLAGRLADKAVRTNRDVRLEPMPSYERKIIHNALQQHEQVKTSSDGSDPRRHVVIHPR
ncbi:KH domain-containing protein [Halobacillus litoralis]|uniref:RNA-binding protein KhpB n=1 Tax=Halobacillus litoralis TaxID=45668 RepID=A0A845DSX6_9BACI|nr:RNA-binding cell elongation regulator Jag/EloR [Halobacillus litoralis]MCA1020482.1 protein jag [Halobacillus litoralis]MYL20703.1 KH domain-containing protein [Halobacillus litoralis]MYL29793.1 KH domain-containing protein [Halobacillus halophilus]MYL39293.1 KH domain-containing protein [Halobacillus litoralis]